MPIMIFNPVSNFGDQSLVSKLQFRTKVYKLMFALELSMKNEKKKIWAAGFSVIPAIIAFGFRRKKDSE